MVTRRTGDDRLRGESRGADRTGILSGCIIASRRARWTSP